MADRKSKKSKKAKPLERTCVWCGCTDSHACKGGCSWVLVHKATPTGICSKCTVKDAQAYLESWKIP
jgi:hypothetical protein